MKLDTTLSYKDVMLLANNDLVERTVFLNTVNNFHSFVTRCSK